MDILPLMWKSRPEILAEAVASVQRAHLGHYEKAGPERIRQ